MNTTRDKTMVVATAGLLVLAIANVAGAHRSEGGSCTDCHTKAGGSLTASPNLLGILKGHTGLETFSITSLGGSTQTAISVQGLENAALNASIAPGGNTWTYINGGSGMSYVSNTITSTGPYTLNLAIGSLATPGTYPIVVMFAGNGERVTTTGFNLQVMAALAGDFNQNGVVDAADYVVWRKGLGTTYTQSDYGVWRSHFGQTQGSGSLANSAIPEPATLVIFLVGLLATMILLARPRTLW